MQYGALLSATWAAYRARWQYLFPLALAGYLAIGAFAFFLVVLLGPFGLLCALLVGAVGTVWIQGVLVKTIDDIDAGDTDLWIGTRLGAVMPSLNALSLAGLIAALGIGLGLVFLLIPGLVLMTWWALAVPAIVVERRGPIAAFRRSRELVRGQGRLVFNFVVATAILTAIATKVLELITAALPATILSSVLGPLVAASLVAPFAALATTVLYHELRPSELDDAASLPAR